MSPFLCPAAEPRHSYLSALRSRKAQPGKASKRIVQALLTRAPFDSSRSRFLACAGSPFRAREFSLRSLVARGCAMAVLVCLGPKLSVGNAGGVFSYKREETLPTTFRTAVSPVGA